jgi:hypothetical protein
MITQVQDLLTAAVNFDLSDCWQATLQPALHRTSDSGIAGAIVIFTPAGQASALAIVSVLAGLV